MAIEYSERFRWRICGGFFIDSTVVLVLITVELVLAFPASSSCHDHSPTLSLALGHRPWKFPSSIHPDWSTTSYASLYILQFIHRSINASRSLHRMTHLLDWIGRRSRQSPFSLASLFIELVYNLSDTLMTQKLECQRLNSVHSCDRQSPSSLIPSFRDRTGASLISSSLPSSSLHLRLQGHRDTPTIKPQFSTTLRKVGRSLSL